LCDTLIKELGRMKTGEKKEETAEGKKDE